MENTSYISKMAYQIEIWLYKGKPIKKIKKLIEQEQKRGKFPPNLELVDAFSDRLNSISGCAFLDKNTGETIIGFAGTNLDNGFMDSSIDISTDLEIFLKGLNPNSPKLKKANEFVNNLKKKGYKVTQTTGHSLGGAICVLVGTKQNIPMIITYNGAPLYVKKTGVSMFAMSAINRILESYTGKIYRFVTNDDILNNAADFANAFYVGEKIIFYNGTGHDINNFLSDVEQAFIKQIIESKNSHWINGSLSIDFDGDGKADITLPPKQMLIKNLFSGNSGSPLGTSITIDPASLLDLGIGFKAMIDHDISWIQQAIETCDKKNDEIKNKRYEREDILTEKVVEGLKESGLLKLLNGIDKSHGELLREENMKILKYFSTFDAYAITRKFDSWGSSAGRRWYKDGNEFDEYELINYINDLKNRSKALLYQITTNGIQEVTINGYTNRVTFITISDIGEAIVGVTNKFLSKTKKVFQGTGLRSGKQDGIVDALSEVFDVEAQNLKELTQNITSLAEMANSLSTNFTSMDSYLKNYFQNGGGKVEFQAGKLPENYQAYLKENKIFDDVKVMKAFDKQVEKASKKLSNELIKDYDAPLRQTHAKFKTTSVYFEEFNTALKKMKEMLNDRITSKKTFSRLKENAKVDYMANQPYNAGRYKEENYEVVKETYQHGTVSSILPSEMTQHIKDANKRITTILDEFYSVTNITEAYMDNIQYLREYIKGEVEKSVYKSMDLKAIIEAQNLIALTINRMREEIEGVDKQIETQFKGKSLRSYQGQLRNAKKLLGYYNQMIDDCFGTKIK